jgi:hypothetical protein
LRSNYPLGKVVTVTQSYLGCKYGQDANGNTVFEPRDEQKGDAARAMMYETVCYTTVGGYSWSLPTSQNQAILKQWHFNDLPSNYEISRNDYIDSLQGNRNPFVDSVDFVCFINFSNMTYDAIACQASVDELLTSNFIVYPNPAKNELNLHVDGTTISAYEIIDIQGRVVLASDVKNVVLAKVNCSTLKAGTYIVKTTTPYGVAQKSIVIE